MLDVVCIGNSLIDAFLTLNGESERCRVDHETHELCFHTDEKVPVDHAVFHVGGNACNVSVGLSRLGLRSSLIVEIGNDAFSHKIKETLEKEGVDVSHVLVHDALASFGMDVVFKNSRIHLVHHVERQHNFSYDTLHTAWVYLSSIGEKWRHVYREVPAFIKRSGAKLAFNPGTRQIDAGREAIEAALEVSYLLFVNKEEGAKIVGIKDISSEREEIKELLVKLHKSGSKVVIVTDGKNGSYALDEAGEFYHQGVIDATVVEKTGAGDSFASGFLAATIFGQDIASAMKWGAVNSASVIGKVGAQPGLLTKEQIEKRV